MKKNNYIFLVIILVLFSCKKEDAETAQIANKNVIPFTQQTALPTQNKVVTPATNPKHNLFYENNVATSSSIMQAVNPAHGQPNHRCDIAVGAPLNSPVNSAVANVPQTQNVPVVQQTVSKKATPKGMNPPHGELNHRCDIAVGAPLNSKPAATTSTTTTQSGVPSLLSTSNADVETPEGMNPPHGKEGHRCDISVGAPLPKT